MEFDLRTSQRREPRGFDEQWAANAAEIENWRSNDIALPTGLDHPVRQPPRYQESRSRKKRAPLFWFSVVAGVAVGGLLLYLFVTLSGIGPPKELRPPTEVRAKEAPVDARRASSAAGSAAQKTAR